MNKGDEFHKCAIERRKQNGKPDFMQVWGPYFVNDNEHKIAVFLNRQRKS